MYKKEFRIVFNPNDDRRKQGDFFEEIISRILKGQRYEVSERINFTGMEIDLIGRHMDRTNENVYIECKARDKLSANDISSFVFKTQFKRAQYGYFISTTEFVHQVAGLINEINEKAEYNNLYFFGPEKVISLLEDTGTVSKLDNAPIENVVKVIVLYTYLGIFKALLISNGTVTNNFTLLDRQNQFVADEKVVQMIQEHIDELSDIEFKNLNSNSHEYDKVIEIDDVRLDSVAEVKRSEEWYDYLPTSGKHFIGRKDILSKYDNFIDNIKNKNSKKRVFYIEGKSGWGKSSLVSAIRDKSKTKRRKNKEYIFAVDTRSVVTTNFVGLAFKKMYESALEDKFFEGFNNKDRLNILSNYDVLGSEFIQELCQYLVEKDKYLVIIFDQFEDVFRNEALFVVFNKFLNDVNNLQSNIIVGFSWKSEITIPIQHKSYHMWQVLKSDTFCVEMRAFDSKEVNGVIGQLQKSISFKLDSSIKRRISESSQGFPWLTKKLCIHIFNEINRGVSTDELLEQELNIGALFEKDIETLNQSEVEVLRYVAKRADSGKMFDVTEIDTVIQNETLASLINKRMIIRSGPKYNIYWDVFRDYLVHGEIKAIGESYLIRQRPAVCYELFRQFEMGKKILFSELLERTDGKYSEKTLSNIINQLLDFGIIRNSNTGYYINDSLSGKDKTDFTDFISNKFNRYIPYIKIIELKNELESIAGVKKVLQGVFPSLEFKEATWETYTRTLISWISYLELEGISNIEIYSFDVKKNGKLRSRKQKTQSLTFMPQKPIMDDIDVFIQVINNKDEFNVTNKTKFLYDLSAIGVLHYWKDDVILSKEGRMIAEVDDIEQVRFEIAKLALKMDKVYRSAIIVQQNNVSNIRSFRVLANELVEHINSDIYKRQTLGKLYNWAKFVIDYNNLDAVQLQIGDDI